MTPPHFQLDDEVEVIGTTTRFKISQLQKKPNGEIVYSAVGEPYYPASSLRLVKELHVGDWVEVVKDTFSCTENDIGKIMRVCSEPNPEDGGIMLDSEMWHHPEGLRKLTPDEIAKHLAPMQVEYEYSDDIANGQFRVTCPCGRNAAIALPECDVGKRLATIESRLNKLGPSHAELLGDVEAIAERIAANEKRLAILEGERPEVISDNHPKDQIHVIIKKMGCKEHQLITYNLRIAKEWCIDVLDSMKET